MNWCIGNYHYRRYSLNAFLSFMEQQEIRAIELWASGPSFNIADYSYYELEKLGRNITSRGLFLSCLTPETCTYPISLSHPDRKYRERSIRYYLDHIDAASSLQCSRLLVTPGVTFIDTSQDELYDQLIEGLGIIADHAERRGVVLCLEPLTRSSTSLVNKAFQLRSILDAVGSSALKGMCDISVAYRVDKENAKTYVKALGPLLSHIHFTDYDERTGSHHLIPGEGTLDLDEELHVLEESGYKGLLSFELLDSRYQSNPDEATQRCIAYTKSVLPTICV